MKFARNVHFQIKSGKETEFNNLFEKEVLPMLRKQNGFPGGSDARQPEGCALHQPLGQPEERRDL